MKNFLTLFKKEMKESLRNGKWIWLPIVLIIIGISQTITNYYMPQILEAAGNLPEGAVIDFPTPTGEEVLMGTMSQYGMIGTLLFVLATMGVISQERQNGSLTLVMVRPVSSLQYIASKCAAQLTILLSALVASYLLTWYYTNILFSPVPWQTMLGSLVVYSLWIVFIVVVTVLFGTMLKSSGGIAGASILFLAALSLATTLFPRFTEWSPGNLRAQAYVILLEGQWVSSVWTVVWSTLGLSVVLFSLAVYFFKRHESFES